MSDTPLVAIVMGSESDRAVMADCETTLAGLGVAYETVVASAHRQPAKVHEWASGSRQLRDPDVMSRLRLVYQVVE